MGQSGSGKEDEGPGVGAAPASITGRPVGFGGHHRSVGFWGRLARYLPILRIFRLSRDPHVAQSQRVARKVPSHDACSVRPLTVLEVCPEGCTVVRQSPQTPRSLLSACGDEFAFRV